MSNDQTGADQPSHDDYEKTRVAPLSEPPTDSPNEPRSTETVLGTPVDTSHGGSDKSETAAVRPDSFGDYEVLGEIARGGMGVVFRARQVSLNRPVALKMILSAQLATDADVQRFRIEAESAAKLDHPGIVPIYEVGEHDGQHFFSMGLVEGGSLVDLAVDGPLAPQKAAALLIRVAEAVQYAHSRNIVHRDLKPANVLLDRAGQPKVTDFGLAKNVKEDSGLTATGQVVGTPAYMPPEQAAGKMDEVGPLADVYSLGAILFYLLTGRPPFQGGSLVKTLQLVVAQEAVSPRQYNLAIDLDLATICLKCLEKEPPQRYQSAAELADELRRYLDGEPIMARPIGRRERAWRWCRRNPVTALLAASAVVALVAGSIVSTHFGIQSRINAGHYRDEYLRAEGLLGEKNQALAEQVLATAEADAAKEEARRRLYVSDMNLAGELYNDGAIDLLRDRLERHIPHADEEDFRGFEWYFWRHATQLEVASFSSPGPPYRIAVAPDGRMVASAHHPGNLLIYDSESKEVVERISLTGGIIAEPRALAFSPDGERLLAAWPENVIRQWDTDSWTELAPLKIADGRYVRDLCVASSASFMVAVDEAVDGSDDTPSIVSLWDTTTWEPISRMQSEPVLRLALSPDGSKLAAVLKSGQVARATNWASRPQQLEWHTTPEVTITPGYIDPGSLAYSPDGGLLAVCAERRVVLLSSALEPVHEFETAENPLCVAFSRDGTRLAAGCVRDNTIQVWNLHSLLNAGIPELHATIRGHFRDVWGLAFSRDGNQLWSGGDMTVRVWDMSRSRPGDLALYILGTNSNLSFSPDGRTLLVHCRDGVIGRWDIRRQTYLEPWMGWEQFSEAAFADGGACLAARSRVDSVLRVWDLTNHHLIGQLPVRERFFTARQEQPLAVSRSGQSLAWAQADPAPDGAVALVSTIDDDSRIQLLWREGTNTPRSVALSPDGGFLAATRGGRLALWDLSGVGPPRRFPTDLPFTLAFSPHGKQLAVGGWGGNIKLYDTRTGEFRILQGHSAAVHSASFSPREARLVSGSFDGTLRIWDTDRSELLTTIETGVIANSVAFAPDGASIAVCGVNDKVLIFDAAPAYAQQTLLETDDPRDVAIACQRTGDWDEAIAHWTRALEEFPSDAELRFGRASAALAVVDYDLAAADFAAATEALGDTSLAQRRIAREYRLALGPDTPISRLDQALLLAPRDPVLHKWRGDALVGSGEWQLAADAYRSSLELAPFDRNSFAAAFSLGMLLGYLGEATELQELCGRYLEANELARDTRVAEGTVKMCLYSGLFEDPDVLDRTKRIVERVLARGPVSTIEWHIHVVEYAMGLVEYRRGRFESALEWLQKSTAGMTGWPAHQSAACTRASVYFLCAMSAHQSGRFDEAKSFHAEAERLIAPFVETGSSLDWLHMQVVRRQAEELLSLR